MKSLASADIFADGPLHSMRDCFARNRRHMIRSWFLHVAESLSMIEIHMTEQDNGAKSSASADMIVDGPLHSMIDCFARNWRHDKVLVSSLSPNR